jgi:hypothetical protein
VMGYSLLQHVAAFLSSSLLDELQDGAGLHCPSTPYTSNGP